MRAVVTLPSGQHLALPALKSWEFLRTDGEGCDSFRVSFPGGADLYETLQGARRFYAWVGEQRVFTGLADELTLSVSASGSVLTLDGRGMGALLVDNQLRAAEFQTAGLEDLLKLCTVPFGIPVRAAAMGTLAGFSIDTGDTCRQALWGFVRHLGGEDPRFDAEGTLLIGQPGKRVKLTLGAAEAVLSRCYCDALTQVVEVPARVHGTVQTYSVSEAAAFPHRKVTVVSGSTLRAGRYTGPEQLSRSRREERTLTLTAPGSFLAEPGDDCELSLPGIGIAGTYRCRSVRSRADRTGRLCTLTLTN